MVLASTMTQAAAQMVLLPSMLLLCPHRRGLVDGGMPRRRPLHRLRN